MSEDAHNSGLRRVARVTAAYKAAPYTYQQADSGGHLITTLRDPYAPRFATLEDAAANRPVPMFEVVDA